MAIQRDFQQFQAKGYKARVRLATTAPLPTYTFDPAANTITSTTLTVLPDQDGITPALNDDLLYWTGAGLLAPDNGIYTVTQLGTLGVAPWILTRRADFFHTISVPSALQVSVSEGLTYAGNIFNLRTPEPIDVNTTDLTFALASSGGGGGGGIFETVANGDTATVPENQILPVFNKLSVEDGKVTGGGKIDLVDTDRNYTQFTIPRRSRYRIPAGQQMLYKGIPRIDGILVADGILTDSSPSGGELLSTLGDVLGPGEMIVGGNSPAVPSDQAAVRANLGVLTAAEVQAIVDASGGLDLETVARTLSFTAEVGKTHVLDSGDTATVSLPASPTNGDRIGFMFDMSDPGGVWTFLGNGNTLAHTGGSQLASFTVSSKDSPPEATYFEVQFMSEDSQWVVQNTTTRLGLELLGAPLGQLKVKVEDTPPSFTAKAGILHVIDNPGIGTITLPLAATAGANAVIGIWGKDTAPLACALVASGSDTITLIDGSAPASTSFGFRGEVTYWMSDGVSSWLIFGSPWSQVNHLTGGTDKLLGTDGGGGPAVFDQSLFSNLLLNPTLNSISFNAVVNTLHRWDGGSTVTMTLPTSPADGSKVGVLEAGGTSNPSSVLTILRGGSNLIDSVAGKGVTSMTVRGQGTHIVLTYDASFARWRPDAGGGVQALLTGGTNRLYVSDTSGRPTQISVPQVNTFVGRLSGNITQVVPHEAEHILREDGTILGSIVGPGAGENNWSPGGTTNWRRGWFLGVSPGSFGRWASGFVASPTLDDFVFEKYLRNENTVDSFYITHEDPASAVANRVSCPGGVTYEVKPLEVVRLVYDSVSSRWSLSSPAKANHIAIDDGTAGTLTQGMPCYIGSGGTALQTDASSASDAKFFGIQNDPRTSITDMCIASAGEVRIPAAQQTGTWTAGDRLYADPAIPGKITNTVPSGVGEFVIPIGVALNTPGGFSAYILIEKGLILEIT